MNHVAATSPEIMGHNIPPKTATEALRLRLSEENEDLLKRINALITAAQRVPEKIGNDDTCGRASDFVKQLTAATKAAEDQRKAEKEPYLESGRVVDAFFNAAKEDLDQAKKLVTERIGVYLREKEEAERLRRAEEARRAEEERKRLEEEAAKQAAAMADEAGMDAALAAEAAALKAAEQEAVARRDAEVKAADIARTRGDYGGVATLRTVWDFKDLSRDQIDLEALRPHLPQDAMEKAVRAYIRAGGRHLRGVTIYERKDPSIR